MKKFINYRAVPVFLLVLIISIAVGTFLHFAYGIVVIAIAAGIFAGVIINKKFRRYASKTLLVLVAIVIGFTSVWITLGLRGEAGTEVANDVEIVGYVSSESAFDADGEVVDIENIILRDVKYVNSAGKTRSLLGYIALTNVSESDFAEMKVGTKLQFKGKLTQIGVNAADGASIRMYRDGINYYAEVGTMIENSGKSTRFNLFDSIKIGVKSVFTQYCGDSAGFMYAMIFGDKQGLNSKEIESFSATGLAHLLAVSGLHVSMLALLLMWILKKLKCNEYVRFVALAIVLVLFNILCCFTPSVVRASIMILICFVGRFLGLKNDSISIMSFAACVILIFRPLYLFDLSFIMSFMAVVSLILFSRPLSKRLAFLPSAISETTSASLSVNAGMMPVMLHYFGTISFVFVLANILVLPIISFIYPVLIAFTCVSFIPYVGYLLVPVGYIFKGLTMLIGALSSLQFPQLNAGVEWAIIIPYILVMIFVSRFVMIDKRIKKSIISVLMIVACLACIIGNNSVMRVVAVDTAYSRPSYNSDKGKEAVYVVTSPENRKYLVFNTEIDSYSLDGIKYYMSKNKISGFEAVIKESISEKEIFTLKNFYSVINMKRIYTTFDGNYYRQYLNIDYYNYSVNSDIRIEFYKANEVMIECGGLKLLFSIDNRLSLALNNEYDVIFAPYALGDAMSFNPKYIVNDYGYNNPATFSDCVSNNFTFKSINGNIKAWQKP